MMCPYAYIPVYSTKQIHNNEQLYIPGGDIPYNGLYGEALPERGALLRLKVYKRVRISQVGVYKRVGKSVI